MSLTSTDIQSVAAAVAGFKYVWFVDPINGNDGTGDGRSETTAWQTIAHAMGQAAATDQVRLMPGTYSEHGITTVCALRGAGMFLTVISDTVTTSGPAFTIGGPVSDLTIKSTAGGASAVLYCPTANTQLDRVNVIGAGVLVGVSGAGIELVVNDSIISATSGSGSVLEGVAASAGLIMNRCVVSVDGGSSKAAYGIAISNGSKGNFIGDSTISVTSPGNNSYAISAAFSSPVPVLSNSTVYIATPASTTVYSISAANGFVAANSAFNPALTSGTITVLASGLTAPQSSQLAALSGGGGAFALTVSVADSNTSAAIVGATVRISGGQSAVATTITGGTAALALNSGTVTVTVTAPGYLSSSAVAVVNSGGDWVSTSTTTLSIPLTALSAPTPAAANQTTGYLTTYDGQGNIKTGVTITFALVNPAVATHSFSQSAISATSDGTGLLQVVLKQKANYQATAPNGVSVDFSTPTASTFQLPPLLGTY